MDREKLRRFITEKGGEIYTFFLHLTGEQGQAEELYQDSFLKAIQLDQLDFDNNPKSYILGLGINLWKNKRRKEFLRRKKVDFTPISQVEEVFEVADNNDIYADLEERERGRIVRSIVWAMADKYRLVVLLYYMEGLSVAEISSLLNIPAGTVKNRLFKARNILKKELEDLL